MENRTYRLCSSPGRFITGRLPDRRQVLIGDSCATLFFFDSAGNFTHFETRELTKPPEIRDGVYYFDPDAQAELEKDVARWSAELQLFEAAIDICAFDANGIHIEDLPGELMELKDHPERFDDEEREELLQWEEEWRELGWYVLWWGDDLWIDRDGTVAHS